MAEYTFFTDNQLISKYVYWKKSSLTNIELEKKNDKLYLNLLHKDNYVIKFDLGFFDSIYSMEKYIINIKPIYEIENQNFYYNILIKLDTQKIENEILNGIFHYNKSILRYLINAIKKLPYNIIDINIKQLLHPCKYDLIETNNKLYSYQQHNVNWLKDIENMNKEIVINNEYNKSKIHEKLYYVGNSQTGFTEDINYKKIKIKGGGLFDEMGCGKTVSMINLIMDTMPDYINVDKQEDFIMKNKRIQSRASLIIVPSQIVDQWASEFEKFNTLKEKIQICKITSIRDIKNNTYDDYINAHAVIMSHQFLNNKEFSNNIAKLIDYAYDNFNILRNLNFIKQTLDISSLIAQDIPEIIQFNWRRVVIDEFQELMENNKWDHVYLFNSDNRHLLSGTPYTRDNFHYNYNIDNYNKICEYLTDNSNLYPKHVKEFQLFRRNTIESTMHETKLNEIKMKEYITWINFTREEKTIYNSQKNWSMDFIRQFCCSPFNTEKAGKFKTFAQIIEYLFTENKKLIIKIEKTIEKAKKDIEEININKNGLADNENNRPIIVVMDRRLRELNEAIPKRQAELVKAQATDNYFNELAKIKQQETERECPICYCDIEEMVITPCGHVFCNDCISSVRNDKCPTCTKVYDKKDLNHVVKKIEEKKENKEYEKYGSKIKILALWIIDMLKNPNNNIILFMEWDSVMNTLSDILKKIGIKSTMCKGNKNTRQKAINEFNNDGRVIMLCSEYASHGVNLTKANKIAIINPIGGEPKYREDIENQAIGRVKRIGQKRDIDIYRFVIRDTIEEKLYNESKGNNANHDVYDPPLIVD